MIPVQIKRQLAPVADSVPEARHSLDELELIVSAENLDALRLLVSELVTNAIEHAGLTGDANVGLLVSVRERLIRVEVHDGGVGFEKVICGEHPPPQQPGGRGLYMVERLSDRWGTEPGELFCVWFELSHDGVHGV